MQIDVVRTTKTENSTIGKMSLDGVYFCATLEPTTREVPGRPVSEWKIQNQTAIPCGTYPVTTSWSPKFNRVMPLVVNVLGFDEVRIHPGNDPKDTDGCCLVGQPTALPDWISQSDVTFNEFWAKFDAAIQAGEPVSITYSEA